MVITEGVWLALVIGGLPLLGWLLWWWNELWYVVPLKFRRSNTGAKLPPGHMGFPVIGEMLTFLWYFKFLRRPNEFIDSKRRKYGDGVGLYRTHLFGSPSLIACFPSVNKFVLQSDDVFALEWPNVDIMGRTSLVVVHGKSHAKLRSYVSNTINRPDSLRRISLHVQPRMVAALECWAQMGKIKAYDEIKKLTLENIGRYFASLEPGPFLDKVDKLYKGMIRGIRAYPLNFPGFACHYGHQCRKKLEEMFLVEIEKKKNNNKNGIQTQDLMDGLMQIRDEDGNPLTDKEVLDNIISLVAGGYESTTLVSMWALYYLAKYPGVLEKLREENMAIRKNSKGDFVTSDDVSKMTYTNKVVEETIRMANVSEFLFRLVIKEVEYKGYKIPKGWKVIPWIRYLHTSPENFKDPMNFNSDRWNEPPAAGTYQVFEGGPRICAGNMLARMQLAILLHHLSIGYKWKLLNPDAGMVYLPHQAPIDGVEVVITKL